MDNEIKTAVIKDAMILVNINEKKKKEILAQNKKAFIQRSLSSRYVKPSKEEALLKKKQETCARDIYEDKNCGGYIKIYPGCNDKYYAQFLEMSYMSYHKLSTPKRCKSNSFSNKIQADEDAGKKNDSLTNISACLANRRAAWS